MTSDTNVGDDSVYLRLVLRLSSSTAIPRLFNRLDTDGISIQQLRRERHGDRPAVNVDLGPLTDTQLETLAITIDRPGDPSVLGDPGEIAPPEQPVDAPVGAFSVTGKTLTSHAPGVERVLLSLDKIVSFRELHLNSSTLDEQDEPIATFTLEGLIGPDSKTERYADGLPEDFR